MTNDEPRNRRKNSVIAAATDVGALAIGGGI
jgi:hypothetical protein